MHSDLFRKQYDFELEQRNALASATSIPIVAVTVVSSAASAAVLDFPYEKSIASYIFLFFISVALVAVVFSVYSVFRSFWNYDYQKLSPSPALKLYFNSLERWHIANGEVAGVATALANTDFEEFLESRLAEGAAWNGQNNLARGNFLHRAIAAVAVAVASLLPAAGLYAYGKTSAGERIQQVRVVDFPTVIERVPLMADTPPPTPAPSATPAAAPAPATSIPTISEAKPVGPPNQHFKSSVELTKPSVDRQIHKK